MSEITQYNAITSVETDDVLVVVDVNDATMSTAGTTKRMTLSQLPFIPGNAGVPSAALTPQVVALTDAATIAVNAELGNDFHVVLGGNRTMGAPSNPADGQKITFEIIQPASGGPYTITWASGSGGYAFGSGSAPVLSSAASATDQASFRYSARKLEWLTLGSNGGF